MMIKGLVCGLAIGTLHYVLFFLAVNRSVKTGSPLNMRYFLASLIRYAVFGFLVYIFLKFKAGSPLGFVAGITVAVVFFSIWGKKYVPRV